MELFAQAIPRMTNPPNVRKAVPVPNKSGAMYAEADGRRWVRKTGSQILAYGLLAEALGWMFSSRLELSVPSVAIHLVKGNLYQSSWLSEVVPFATHWSSEVYPIKNLPDLAGLLVLDVVFHNEDRHVGNILVQPLDDGTGYQIWGIDFESALVGKIPRFCELADKVPSLEALPADLPFEGLRDHADSFAKEVAELPPRFITSAVTDGCALINSKDAPILDDALAERCANAPLLVDTYFAQLTDAP